MKKVLISVLTIIFIVSMISVVYAATGTITMGASSDSVIKGKTFTVTIAAMGDDNVTGIKGTISYDTTKLVLEEKGTANGFTEVGAGNELNAGILSLDGVELSKTVTIYTLKFKVLDDAAEGDTEISISNVELGLVNNNQEQIDTTANDEKVAWYSQNCTLFIAQIVVWHREISFLLAQEHVVDTIALSVNHVYTHHRLRQERVAILLWRLLSLNIVLITTHEKRATI